MKDLILLLLISMILFFLILIILVIDITRIRKKLVNYLRSRNMQEELMLLDVRMGNVIGLKSAKRIREFYSTVTEDDILNRLKIQINHKGIRIVKLAIYGFAFIIILSFITAIISSIYHI